MFSTAIDHVAAHHSSVAHGSAALTTAGSAGALLFWGLHLSDIAVIVSTVCAVCGVIIQTIVALHSIKKH